MSNFVRASVAFCLLATVASAATIPTLSVTFYGQFPGDVTMKLVTAGANGQLKGKGQLNLFKTTTYPITVTSGSSTNAQVLFAGRIKRHGLQYPFTLVLLNNTREATLEIFNPLGTPVLNTLDGIGSVEVR